MLAPPALALAATAISLAVAPAALAAPLSFTNKTINELGVTIVSSGTTVYGVYASGSNVYASINGGGLSFSSDGGATFTTKTQRDGLFSNIVRGVYASGSSVYAATSGGLSIAALSAPPSQSVPGPLPLAGAATAFGFARRLRRCLRPAAA